MARVSFEPQNQRGDAAKFPKIKLEKDQSARVLLVEDVPWSEYVHTLRAPKIVNGVPQTETRRRRDGSEFTAHVMDFIGRPICHGDRGVLDDRGLDPKNCPACALAKQSPDMVEAPQRRFAMHVIEYATKQSGSGTEVSTPFQVSLKVWAFAEKVFDKIVALKSEWGDLRQHDLLLGPCTNPTFQQYEIGISPKAEWLASDERKKLVGDTYKENRISDQELAEFCGRNQPRRYMEEDLDKIRDRWALVNGHNESPTGPDAGMESLDAGLDDLLTSQTGMSQPAEEVVQEIGSALDMGVTDEAPFEGASKEDAPAEKENLNFDDLLGL